MSTGRNNGFNEKNTHTYQYVYMIRLLGPGFHLCPPSTHAHKLTIATNILLHESLATAVLSCSQKKPSHSRGLASVAELVHGERNTTNEPKTGGCTLHSSVVFTINGYFYSTTLRYVKITAAIFQVWDRGWCEYSHHLEGVSLSLAEELFVHERGGQSSPQVQATGRQHYGGLQTPRHADRRQNLALLPTFNITKCRFVTSAVFHMHMILLSLVLLLCIINSTLLCRSEKWGENGEVTSPIQSAVSSTACTSYSSTGIRACSSQIH